MGHEERQAMLEAGPTSQAIADLIPESWGSVVRGGLRPTTIDSEDPLSLRPGRVVGLEGPTGLGLTRVGLSMLAEPSQHAPVVVVDVRGWICPTAAWESGVRADRLAVVRCNDVSQWAGALAALLEGVKAIYAEVPDGVTDQVLRRLSAMARSRDASVVFRPLQGRLPAGIAYLRVRAEDVVWTGAHDGHGRLEGRRMTVELSGKGAAGRSHYVELEDDGSHALRVVSRLAATKAGRAAG